MAQILIKPTDQTSASYTRDLQTYNRRLETVRAIASPDITTPLTIKQLPDTLFDDEYFIDTAEDKVLRDTGISTVPAITDPMFSKLLRLVLKRLAIGFIPQVAQIIREGFLQDTVQYQTVDWEKRIEELQTEYAEEVTEINPVSKTLTGSLRSTTLISNSRVND